MSLEYRLIKLIGSFLCCLPHRVILNLGSVVGFLYYHISKKARTRAIENICNRLHLPEKEAKKIALKCFYNVGKSFVEILYMPCLRKDTIDRFIEMEGEEYLQEALSEGRGVVLVTAHLGNWEWLAARLSLSGFPLTAIVQKQPDDVHTEMLNEYRELVGVEVISRKSAQIVRTVKVLKRGRVLGFLVDAPVGKEGMELEFLGKKALIAMGPAFFACKLKVPVVPVFIQRMNEKHKVCILPPLTLCDRLGNVKDKERVMREILDVVENKIKEIPSEWLWMMKRWTE